LALIGPRGRRALGLAQRFLEEQRALVEHVLETRRSVRLTPEGGARGAVLLSCVLEAFDEDRVKNLRAHTNVWESCQIAETFLELGFEVDVISFRNYGYLVRRPYDVLVSSRTNLELLAPQVGPDCLKLLHADVAHVLFHNAAEANRLLALQQRRGVTLAPRRYSAPNLAIEHADCATVNGNAFTMETYAYAGKPVHRVHKSALVSLPSPADRDFDAARRRFVWLSSDGLVHKGLDLVLEAFAELPHLELLVAAPLEQEPDFEAAYERELHGLPNIEVLGWIDVTSSRFEQLARTCAATVYPSCSEGGGGSVLDCLHAGLVPIVTREASVDIDDFGSELPAAGVEEIKEAVTALSETPANELRERAVAAWEHARANHTRKRFAEDYRDIAERLLAYGPTGAPAATAAPGA